MSENTTQVRGVEFKACGCGCAQPVAKATFRPGHDARLVSVLVRRTVQGPYTTAGVGTTGVEVNFNNDTQAVIDEVVEVLNAKVSHPLAVKYDRAAHNAWYKSAAKETKAEAHRAAKEAREEAKAAKQGKKAAQVVGNSVDAVAAAIVEATQVEDQGTIKVGRWTYPVRMTSAGRVQRNAKRDGSGEWMTIDDTNAIVWAS